MTPKQQKLAYELITNPPAGSAIAAAKEWGVDLTLLYENLLRTPAQSFASIVRSFNKFRGGEKRQRSAK